MKKKDLYIVWAGLFALCAGLGFIHQPSEPMKALMVMVSLAFFVTPVWLLHKGSRQDALIIRIISIASLALTTLALVANVLSVRASALVGDLVYAVMIVVSTPMVCSQFWAVSIFIWACLMLWSFRKTKK